MKHQHVLQNYSSRIRKSFRRHTGLHGVFLFTFLFLMLFFFTRGGTPHTSELTYVEHSRSGGVGSVVPASCDSPPWDAHIMANGNISGSHFYKDCQVPCPAPSPLFYDPYFDPGQTACTPAVKVGVGAGDLRISTWVTVNNLSGTFEVSPGTMLSVRWGASGAGISCTKSWSGGGPVAPNGGPISIQAPTDWAKSAIFELVCTNPEGFYSKSMTVVVTPVWVNVDPCGGGCGSGSA